MSATGPRSAVGGLGVPGIAAPPPAWGMPCGGAVGEVGIGGSPHTVTLPRRPAGTGGTKVPGTSPPDRGTVAG